MMKRWKISADTVLMALLVVSVVFNWVLVYRPNVVSRSSRRPAMWTVGTIAPPLIVDDTEGQRVWLEWDAQKKPTVLYLFSPDCGWCDRNLQGARMLITLRSDKYDVTTIALMGPSGWGNKPRADLGVKPYSISSTVRKAGYALSGTPQTVVIGQRGKILANWMGAYNTAIQKDIERVLGVQVPVAAGAQ
jgi:hypothetical protein